MEGPGPQEGAPGGWPRFSRKPQGFSLSLLPSQHLRRPGTLATVFRCSPRYTRKAPPGWKDTTPGSTHAGTRRISDSAQPHAGAHPTQPPRRLRVGAVTNERKDTPGATVTWPSTPLGADRQHCIHLLQHYHDRPPLTPPPSWALLSILLETWPCSTRRDREAWLVPISHSSLDLPLSPIGHCHCHSPK